MNISLPLSVLFLAVMTAAAVLAIDCKAYRENWLQALGLWGLIILGPAKTIQLLERGHSSPENALLFGALAAFAVGTALKVRHHVKHADAET